MLIDDGRAPQCLECGNRRLMTSSLEVVGFEIKGCGFPKP